MTKTPIFLGLFIAFLSLLPQGADAYRVENAAAYRVTPSHVLFSIPFNAGFLNRTALTPLFVSTNEAAKHAVIVSVRDAAGTTVNVPLRGIVLAEDLKRMNDYYVIPEGTRSDFTLIAVAEIPQGAGAYELDVVRFPYLLVDSEKQMTQTVVASPLIEAFVTPTVR